MSLKLRILERHALWLAALCALAGEIACNAQSPEPDDAPPPPPSRETTPHDLIYSRNQHLRALDEEITVIKTPGGVYAIRANGKQQSLLEVEAAERAARFARWGAIDPDFAGQLGAAAPAVPMQVAFHFDPHVDWSRLTPELQDGATHDAAQAELTAAIETGARQLSARLTSAGVGSAWYRSTIPIVFGAASPAAIQSLARMPDLTLITSDEPGQVQLHAGTPNTISDPQIDTGMNALGLFGANQKIGFLEEAKCGLYDPHESLSLNSNPVAYEVEPMDCTSDSQCTNCDLGGGAMCLALGHPGHPKQCVAVHASETASCVSATRGGTGNGAAKASLFHPNAGGSSPLSGHPTSVACSASGTADAYHWLTGKGVTTANESWGCAAPLGTSTAATLEGITEDWYARNFGISIFKSAGNFPAMTACPFTLNSICVGGTNTAHAMSCFSSFLNPPNATLKSGDREEPDITALGGDASDQCSFPLGQVDVMQVGNPTGWTGNDGTSFSSPAMAGFAALLKESCGGNLDEKLVRVIMRNAGWPRNPDGWRYSTPKPGFDHKDGGGSPIAGAAVAFCQPGSGGPNNKSGTNPGILKGGHPGPSGTAPPQGAPPGEQRSATAPGPADGRQYDTFFQTRFVAGNRIRVSMAWDSCPASMSGTAPASVATDYDLFLYNEDTHTYVYSSQSFDDSNEGFDVTIPSDGNYTVYYAWPSGASGCAGSGSEPFAWAVTWWQ